MLQLTMETYKDAEEVVHPSSALEFMRLVGRLKTTNRTGWVNHGVHLPESIADLMYRMSVMSMLLTDERLNKDKLVKSISIPAVYLLILFTLDIHTVCLMHDLAEAVVGDITPYQGISKEEKRQLEEVINYFKRIQFIRIIVQNRMRFEI